MTDEQRAHLKQTPSTLWQALLLDAKFVWSQWKSQRRAFFKTFPLVISTLSLISLALLSLFGVMVELLLVVHYGRLSLVENTSEIRLFLFVFCISVVFAAKWLGGGAWGLLLESLGIASEA